MDHRKSLHHGTRFVALQASDEMPLQIQVKQLFLLGRRFLETALTKGDLPMHSEGSDRFGRMPLAHRQKARRGRKCLTQSLPTIDE